jgi:hypothetical protein
MTSDDRANSTTQDAVICLVCSGAYRERICMGEQLGGNNNEL